MNNFEDGFNIRKEYNKNTGKFLAVISDSSLPHDVRGNWLDTSISMLTHHLADINSITDELIPELYPAFEFCLYYQSFDKESLESIMILGFEEVDEKFCISWNSDISKTSIILFEPEDDIDEITNITMKLTLCGKYIDDGDMDYEIYIWRNAIPIWQNDLLKASRKILSKALRFHLNFRYINLLKMTNVNNENK